MQEGDQVRTIPREHDSLYKGMKGKAAAVKKTPTDPVKELCAMHL